MRRLKLVERYALSANGGGERTHICLHESFTYATNVWEHNNVSNEVYKVLKKDW